ncbi:MAG: 30S ribosomal protein S9 [Candidatus Andersenbacteria bacterium]
MPTKPRAKKPAAAKAATKTAPKAASKPAVKNVSAYYAAVGRRKTSVSRVRLSTGKGSVTVNGRTLDVYFPDAVWQTAVRLPLVLVGKDKDFDVSVLTSGGGVNSQAGATRHAVARALEKFDPTLRPTLKKAGLLTRDSREKERKKPGLKRARRAPQFSMR